jgi:Cu/Ag efflux protein CusF
MRHIKFTTFVALLMIGAIAGAADEPVTDEKPSFFARQSVKVTAVVEAIDHETRLVTLRRAEGDLVTFTAGEEARNLDQVAVGDIVNAEYEEVLSIKVVANDGTEPEKIELGGMARSEEGEMPGLSAFDSQRVIATVEEINLEENTFKLKGPDGAVSEYVARNPDNLRKSAVGDLVIITTSQAVAISVEVGPTE